MSSARIAYSQHPEVTAEAELSALAAVYKLCLERSHAKRGRLLDKSGPGDGTKTKEDSAYEHSST